jgi:hypothetical protein
MLSETLLATLAGGAIGFFSALGVIMFQNWLDTRKKRGEVIDAIDAATRSAAFPAILSTVAGGSIHTNVAEQFLAAFWRDLAVLGTRTQLMVITYFAMVTETIKMEGGGSKQMIEQLEGMRQDVLDLIEEERKGQRQNISKDRLTQRK